MAQDKGLLFFYDWKVAFEALSGEDCKALLLAMLDYKQNGVQPPAFEGGAKIAASFVFPAIDRSIKCSSSGRSGGEATQKKKAKGESASSGASSGASNGASSTKQNKTETKQYKTDSMAPSAPDTLSPPEEEEKRGNMKKPQRHKYGQYNNVLLTDKELEKLRERYPAEYQQKIEDLSDYMKRVGKKYADHYLTLLKWLEEDADKPKDRGGGGKTKPLEMSSFDTDEFYNAAVRRSYENVDIPGA